MADYDVQALSLATPPQAAPVSSYRPAVCVRNNGIHPADVTGTLRIYRREPPGDLLETHPVSLAGLAAGAEGNAQSSGYWTPTVADIGREYLFIAEVTTDQDQEPDNNNLAPVTVLITAAEPPPPPPITAHATQHETGGADQVNIEGLHGKAADGQTPEAHKASHQAGGSDLINVNGLAGVLLEGQPIADHHESHEDGGGDQLYVAGLHGVLADNQPAIVHDNAKHDPNYATVTELGNHLADTTNVHAAATNLEQVAHKGLADGYAGLGADTALVPPAQLGIDNAGDLTYFALRRNSSWGPITPGSLCALTSAIHITEDTLTTILQSSQPIQPDGTDYHITTDILLSSITGANSLLVELLAGVSIAALTPIAFRTFSIAAGAADKYIRCDFRAQKTDGELQGAGICFSTTGTGGTMSVTFPSTTYASVVTGTYIRLRCKLTSAGTSPSIWVLCAAFKQSTI